MAATSPPRSAGAPRPPAAARPTSSGPARPRDRSWIGRRHVRPSSARTASSSSSERRLANVTELSRSLDVSSRSRSRECQPRRANATPRAALAIKARQPIHSINAERRDQEQEDDRQGRHRAENDGDQHDRARECHQLGFRLPPKGPMLFPLGHDRTEVDRLAEFLDRASATTAPGSSSSPARTAPWEPRERQARPRSSRTNRRPGPGTGDASARSPPRSPRLRA